MNSLVHQAHGEWEAPWHSLDIVASSALRRVQDAPIRGVLAARQWHPHSSTPHRRQSWRIVTCASDGLIQQHGMIILQKSFSILKV